MRTSSRFVGRPITTSLSERLRDQFVQGPPSVIHASHAAARYRWMSRFFLANIEAVRLEAIESARQILSEAAGAEGLAAFISKLK